MKTPGLRDEDYLEWVRRLPCVIHDHGVRIRPWAHLQPVKISDPHHLPVRGLKGHSIKSPDTFVVPVCSEDHRICEQHYTDPSRVYGFHEATERGLPPRWFGVNLFEIVSWLQWSYQHPPAWVTAGVQPF